MKSMKPIAAPDGTLHCPVCDAELEYDGELWCPNCHYVHIPDDKEDE